VTDTEVVVLAVCFVRFAPGVVWSLKKQTHPVDAPGSVITPLEAVPPVPTLIVKASVPLLATTDGDVPKPEEMVGSVVKNHTCPLVPFLRFACVTVPLKVNVAMAGFAVNDGGPADPDVLPKTLEAVTLPVTESAGVVTVPVNVGEASGAHVEHSGKLVRFAPLKVGAV
jgi:hypothetical protein